MQIGCILVIQANIPKERGQFVIVVLKLTRSQPRGRLAQCREEGALATSNIYNLYVCMSDSALDEIRTIGPGIISRTSVSRSRRRMSSIHILR